MKEAKEQIDAFKVKLLNENLSQCTVEEQEFFKRLYPNGPSPSQMDWAIQQAINTLKKKSKKEIQL